MKIVKTEKRYYRTESGKSWSKVPFYEDTEEVTETFHYNYTCDAARRFWHSRHQYSYTPCGYKVTRATTICPYKPTYKIVTTFEFVEED